MNEMIPLSEILARVPPFDAEAASEEPDLEALESALQTGTYLGWSMAFSQAMKVRPIHAWLCTDRMVGVYAYYFREQFVALSFQRYRKSEPEFRWVSVEAAKSVSAFIRQLSEADESPTITVIDEHEQVPGVFLGRG